MSEENIVTETKKKKCSPPHSFARNDFGLLTHIDYIFNEYGDIDWRKMIRSEFLTPKKGVNIADLSNLPDEDLLIKLGGIKQLARLRGYTSVTYKTIVANPTYVSLQCEISWIGNYETGGKNVLFSACADAHSNNTKDFTKQFLTTIAENRAFVRAVRNFLGINIVGQDEIGGDNNYKDENSDTSVKVDPKSRLINLIKSNGIDFERFKNRMIKEEWPGADAWESFKDIEEETVLELTTKVAEIIAARKAEPKK